MKKIEYFSNLIKCFYQPKFYADIYNKSLKEGVFHSLVLVVLSGMIFYYSIMVVTIGRIENFASVLRDDNINEINHHDPLMNDYLNFKKQLPVYHIQDGKLFSQQQDPIYLTLPANYQNKVIIFDPEEKLKVFPDDNVFMILRSDNIVFRTNKNLEITKDQNIVRIGDFLKKYDGEQADSHFLGVILEELINKIYGNKFYVFIQFCLLSATFILSLVISVAFSLLIFSSIFSNKCSFKGLYNASIFAITPPIVIQTFLSIFPSLHLLQIGKYQFFILYAIYALAAIRAIYVYNKDKLQRLGTK